MKKVNLLIGILYINTLILIIISSYFFRAFIELVIFFITKKEPEIVNFSDMSNFYEKLPIMFLLWFAVYFVFSVINIVSLIFDYKNNNLEILFNKMKRIKMGIIPYWVINFICYIPISAILLIAGHGFGFIIVPIFIFASYTVLILTSIFTIVYLKLLRKNNIIMKNQFIIHTILQLFFVIDIIDTIYLIKILGKPNVA